MSELSYITLYPSANAAWLDVMNAIMDDGDVVSPRGQRTFELIHVSFAINAKHPVVTIPARKLSYRFMCAEAYWILSGDDRVATIAPYNKNISQFSDDGERFFGAYGPPYVAQRDYVVDRILHDHDTRQAVMMIWRPNPPITKDVPCTVAIDFKLRGGYLSAHVYMRSSDVWLGLPYDMFNFSMMIADVADHMSLNMGGPVGVGSLIMTLGSSHLYDRDLEGAHRCHGALAGDYPTRPIPFDLIEPVESEERRVAPRLALARDDKSTRWWVP